MTKTLFLSILCFSFCIINAQITSDTIYLNHKDEKVTPNEAKFIKIIQSKKDNLFPFLKYTFPNNQLVLTGTYKSLNPNISEGKFIYYHKTTQKINYIHNYANDTLNGEVIENDSLGRLYEKRYYINGKIEGEETTYDTLGNVAYLYLYTNGKLNGIGKSYYGNGKIRRMENYENDTFISGKYFTLKGDDTTFFRYKTSPKPTVSFHNFVNDNFNYNSSIKFENGTVTVQFVVLEDGSIDTLSIKIMDGMELVNLTQEAIRIVKLIPNYTPETYEGKPLKTKCKTHISYYTEEEYDEDLPIIRKKRRGR